MARRVLITGARAAVALDTARDFADAGWEVHLADSVPSRMARWSALRAQHHAYPAPRQRPSDFAAGVERLADAHQIDRIVPTCEEVYWLAAQPLREALGDRLFAPDLATLRSLHDKFAFAQTAQGWGLNAPESRPIDTQDDLAELADASSEWVFKPRFSRFGESALIGPEAKALRSIRPTPEAPWLAQRLIRGDEACFHAAAYHGRLVAFAAYRSPWRLKGGAGYAFEPTPKEESEALRAIAQTLASKAGIHGQFACDVMRDEAGSHWLLECNPRATSGAHFLTGGGDFARAVGDGIPMPAKASGSLHLGPAMLVFGLPQALFGGQWTAWREQWRAGRDVIARPSDRQPLAGALVDAARFMLSGVWHGVSTNAATTRDIEWNGEELER